MQSPCRNEVSEACFKGCCPTPLNFPTNQMEVAKKTSTFSESRRDFSAATTSSIFPKIHFTNYESIPSLEESFSVFIKAYPHYRTTRRVDNIRAKEYFNLSISNLTCLDYIGIGLFSYSQLQKQDSSSSSSSSSSSPLNSHFPSPPRNLHSLFFDISNKTGNLKTQLLYEGYESELESGMKKRIFRFLNISENDYSIVFTANRTSAFKLLAESYPFKSSNKLLTVYDYESEAVEVMISSSEKRGAEAMSAEFSWPRMRIRSAKLREMIVFKNKKKKTKTGLFVFPLHSRVTGARYPYLWMSIAQENRWHILIDACALGPKDMDSFGLSLFRPDFLVCSFYKVFGENPSGFGCLFVKKSTIQILEDSSTAGIVSLVQPETKKSTEFQSDKSQLATSSSFSGPILSKSSKNIENSTFKEEEISEDLYLPEMECKSLDQVDSLGLTQIATRARCLMNWLVSSMMKLKHPNPDGNSLIRIYGPKIKFDRGAALAFNVFDWKGEKVEPVLVQKLADRSSISLSYGFLHHIWFSDKYAEQKGRFLERKVDGGKGIEKEKKKAKPEDGIAVVTAAFGFLTNFEDAYKLWAFIAQFLDPDFVEKERWRYTALNQKIIKISITSEKTRSRPAKSEIFMHIKAITRFSKAITVNEPLITCTIEILEPGFEEVLTVASQSMSNLDIHIRIRKETPSSQFLLA